MRATAIVFTAIVALFACYIAALAMVRSEQCLDRGICSCGIEDGALVENCNGISKRMDRLDHELSQIRSRILRNEAAALEFKQQLDTCGDHQQLMQVRLDAYAGETTRLQHRLDGFGQWAKELAAYLKSREGCK